MSAVSALKSMRYWQDICCLPDGLQLHAADLIHLYSSYFSLRASDLSKENDAASRYNC